MQLKGAVAAYDAHVTAAGSEIDTPGANGFTVYCLERRAPAGARKMLGQDGGEGSRHMLHDQNRGLIDDVPDVADHDVKRLWAAG